MDAELRRARVVVAASRSANKGLLVEDHRVAPYCPRCGTGAVRPRARAGVRDGGRPVGLRALPAHRPVRTPRTARRCSSGRRRRGRSSPTPRSPCTPTSPTSWPRPPDGRAARRRGAAGAPPPSARRGASWRATSAAELERCAYQRPFELRRDARRRGHFVVTRRLRHHRGRHRARAPGARVRRRRPRASAGRTACRSSTRSARTGTSHPRCRSSAASSSSTPTRRSSRTSRRAGCCSSTLRLRARLPALLAVPHAAALLRAAVLVHPHDRGQGRAAAGERAHPSWYPRQRQVGPLRRLAAQQHRLGALAQPLLGHAAADLALRVRPHRLRRLARGARRSSPGRTCRTSTRTGRSSTTSRWPAPSAARSMQRVPEVIDVWYDSGSMPFAQWGYPHVAGQRRGVRGDLPGGVHLRGDRPDARLVLHADGGRHARVRPVVVRERAVPRAHPRRGRPQDEQAPRQHPRAHRARWTRTAPTRCAGSWPRAGRRGWRAGSGTPRCRRSCARCC